MSWHGVTLLDCTLRDGGFYTKWDYPFDMVCAYLRAVDDAGVDYAEIGYRSLEAEEFAGTYHFASDDLIATLPPTRRTKLAVMIDAKEFANRESAVDALFGNAAESRVRLVRVATSLRHCASAVAVVGRIRARGYMVSLNLMAVGSIARQDLPAALRQLAACDADVVYVADSFGSMLPCDVRAVGCLLGASCSWGIHLHNNLELAFANALEAVETGATWVDASILGMGRGAGNLRMELLLQYLETRVHRGGVDAGPIHAFISRELEGLHRKFGWGPARPYVVSGMLPVHPMFAQVLIGSARYTSDEVVQILSMLHGDGRGDSFSLTVLESAAAARVAADGRTLTITAPLPTEPSKVATS
jgi:4-hydroxy 2-oxovalerate aldolase